jgi:hypothetical protein
MFSEIKVPFDSVMLYNVAKLKEGVTIEDVEENLAMMCNIVKNKYEGFIAGQVFKYSGFISEEGSVGDLGKEGNHIAILTYWSSFEEHERSHADKDFKNEFCKLMDFCEETKELGYELLWQGNREDNNETPKSINDINEYRGH